MILNFLESVFSMDVSPFVRNSFWSVMVGNLGVWLTDLAIHPGAFQRSLSLPTLSQAKRYETIRELEGKSLSSSLIYKDDYYCVTYSNVKYSNLVLMKIICKNTRNKSGCENLPLLKVMKFCGLESVGVFRRNP